MKKLITVMLLVSIVAVCFGQHPDRSVPDELEDLIESVLSEDESKDVEQLLDELQFIKEHPFNINQAKVSDLKSLYLLNQSQIDALMDYRNKFGQILSVYELAAIDGFSPKLANLLSDFVVFETEEPAARSSYRKDEVLFRGIRLVEKQAGFEDGKYEGSPDKLYVRYRHSSTHLQGGFTGEKDAGESFFQSSNSSGFDFYSGFARLDFGEKKPIVFLGDYVVQFGQGLAAWQGFALGKSAEVTHIAKFNQGIKSYSSTDENNFMRGIATSFECGDMRFSAFFSDKNFDANTDSVDGQPVFTSIQTSGLHRTMSEIDDENSVKVVSVGGNVVYEAENLSVGLTGIHVEYQYPLIRQEYLYNQFLFSGRQVTNFSADYRWSINGFYAFGEMAVSANGGLATLHGILLQPVDQVEFSALYRNINKHYNAAWSSAFTENSRVNDEAGMYLGTRFFPAAKLSLNMYADFFQYKWVKYTTSAPGKGHEYLAQINYKINQGWESYCRYFYECKPVKLSGEQLSKNINQVRQSVRFQLTGNINAAFTLKSRGELSFYQHDHYSSGFFISQDLGYHPVSFPLTIWTRLAYFDTDDYDSRVYAYENDLLYQFSVPALYGKGVRSYFVGKVKICEKTELWLKVSRSWLLGVESMGSGNSRIDGNKRTELKLQIRFRI